MFKRSTIECGCEQGADCTKTTVCAIDSATEDLQDRITELEADYGNMKNAWNTACQDITELETKVEIDKITMNNFLGQITKLEAQLEAVKKVRDTLMEYYGAEDDPEDPDVELAENVVKDLNAALKAGEGNGRPI